jgi:hypothetical protein
MPRPPDVTRFHLSRYRCSPVEIVEGAHAGLENTNLARGFAGFRGVALGVLQKHHAQLTNRRPGIRRLVAAVRPQ